jgi:hypothetical protein
MQPLREGRGVFFEPMQFGKRIVTDGGIAGIVVFQKAIERGSTRLEDVQKKQTGWGRAVHIGGTASSPWTKSIFDDKSA